MEAEAVDQFYRYACITSNLLEDVFQVEGQSCIHLVRRGFHINSIEGSSVNSKLKKKHSIIQILKNTKESLQCISTCLGDPSKFTPDLFKESIGQFLKITTLMKKSMIIMFFDWKIPKNSLQHIS